MGWECFHINKLPQLEHLEVTPEVAIKSSFEPGTVCNNFKLKGMALVLNCSWRQHLHPFNVSAN